MKKLISEGGMIPRGYGVAWRCNNNFQVLCLPIGINIIYRFFMNMYYKIIRGWFKAKWDNELLKIRMEEDARFREDYQNRLLSLQVATQELKQLKYLIELKERNG